MYLCVVWAVFGKTVLLTCKAPIVLNKILLILTITLSLMYEKHIRNKDCSTNLSLPFKTVRRWRWFYVHLNTDKLFLLMVSWKYELLWVLGLTFKAHSKHSFLCKYEKLRLTLIQISLEQLDLNELHLGLTSYSGWKMFFLQVWFGLNWFLVSF